MFQKFILILSIILLSACAELQQVVNQFPQSGVLVSEQEIAGGLRQALDLGIERQVSSLTETDGFFGNELVRILLPEELQKVDKGLRDIGLHKLADEGLKVLNRAAESAVKEATPIFVDAVKNISFSDARNILLGNDQSATNYLKSATSKPLYNRFIPVVSQSLNKTGATDIWKNLINKYNSIPFVKPVNANLPDYVTGQALKGVFTMIGIEEQQIRNKFSSRTTDLLKKVFALQDKK